MISETTSYFLRLHEHDYQQMIADCKCLTYDQLWQTTPGGVSIANYLSHTCEMECFWIDWGLCSQGFDRDRQIEFDRQRDASTEDIVTRLSARQKKTARQIKSISDQDFNRSREFHNDTFTGTGILTWHIHHVGLHRGHIQAHTRWLKQSKNNACL